MTRVFLCVLGALARGISESESLRLPEHLRKLGKLSTIVVRRSRSCGRSLCCNLFEETFLLQLIDEPKVHEIRGILRLNRQTLLAEEIENKFYSFQRSP